MNHKEFIRKLTKLKKGNNLKLGNYCFYRHDKFFVFNISEKKIDAKYELGEILFIANDYRQIIARYSNKPLTGRERIYFSGRFTKNEKTNK